MRILLDEDVPDMAPRILIPGIAAIHATTFGFLRILVLPVSPCFARQRVVAA